ncbi:phosphoribosylglycinamide formyltransferase [Thiomicrorhabdus sediminis]|uniref:Phosphoribosylglycinamide formyltransferase n=1 Tax=Thiomicrorhabdus sediminis TaxID=2580412 RepID=A0A4P9K4I5_9GAMM|nr:phosphoribosylglycinamide formyltransferase [Thiomicrorhabdus sediminis]QCU89828.1 phosphoribosylglycinamide formyltransferase [Thiomicrorhabdus sediminis]
MPTLSSSSDYRKKRIAVLISGNGSNLQAIIDHQQQHAELYEIAIVISNRPQAFGLKRAADAHIEQKVIDHTEFDSREAFDAELQKLIDSHQIDLVVLAGFMRILTQDFTRHYLGRMLNIHPSLLPKYTGLNTHTRAIEAGDKEHGLSIHFVTPELDGGPVILQAKLEIGADDSADSLAEKVHRLEHLAYPQVVQWFVEDRLSLKDNHAWLDQNCLQTPVEFNADI